MALAGMLEIADREFQAIQGAEKEIVNATREMVNRGDLVGVEITPFSLKQFLDKKLGADGRISEWAYDWDAQLLKTLGFRDLKQIETAIAPYDDNQISVTAFGNRQGQLTRFETILLAALGEHFIDRHPWKNTEWFAPRQREYLKKMNERESEHQFMIRYRPNARGRRFLQPNCSGPLARTPPVVDDSR